MLVYPTWKEDVAAVAAGKAVTLTTIQQAEYRAARQCVLTDTKRAITLAGNLRVWPISLGAGSGLGAFILHNNTRTQELK